MLPDPDMLPRLTDPGRQKPLHTPSRTPAERFRSRVRQGLGLLAVVLLGIALAWGKGGCHGGDVARNWLRARLFSRTVDQAVARVYAARPGVRALAESAGGALQILVFKHEGLVEVSAPGWDAPRTYPMTARSGRLGPKLREGDGQIPEGVYRVESLNPNSLYHLALRLDYPNAFDRARARDDGRTGLGGDIMIHGSDRSVGCVAIGDSAIEELFCCAAAVGPSNITVLLSPCDLRLPLPPALALPSAPPWYPSLLSTLRSALLPAAALLPAD